MRVAVSVCLTMLAATYLVYISEVRRHTVSCRHNMYCVDFAVNVSFGRYGIICHDDQQLGSSLTKNTPMVFDTIRYGIV